MMKRSVFLRAVALIAVLLITLPVSSALATGDAAPSILGITQANGELTLLFSEPVQAVAGKTITLSSDGVNYTATLSASDSPARQYSLAINTLLDESNNPPTLVSGTVYQMSVAQGAFLNSAGNGNSEQNDLSLTASSEGSFTVVHDLGPDMGWKLVGTSSEGVESDVSSGAVVPAGTTVKAVASGGDNPCTFAVYSGGQRASDANLKSGCTVSADMQIYTEAAALSGAASITGVAEYGKALTAAYTPADGVTGPSKLFYQWTRGDVALSAGADATAYTLTKDDIGKTVSLTISSPWCTGTVSAESATVAKAAVAAPAAPTVQSQTGSSVTLNTTDGCEYRVGEADWQVGTEFTGLVTGQTYSFYQRIKETETHLLSPISPACTVKLTQGLSGTVIIEGVPQLEATLKANATSNATGELTYRWKRGTTEVGTSQSYPIQQADYQQSLTVEVTCAGMEGMIHATTAAVTKKSATAPAAPTIYEKTANSVTLNTVAGCEYSIDGVNWRDVATFENLTPGQTYTFYQRYKETAAAQASPVSAGASVVIASNLSGAIQVAGEVRYGKTLVASYNGAGGSLTYLWYRGATQVGTGATYDVVAADIGNPIYVRVVSSAASGSITQLVGTAGKAEYVGVAPDAPTRASRSTSKISLKSTSGYEYSRDGSNWQESAVFTGLKAGTSYRFYQRVQATATVDASPASVALTTSTSASSSSGSSSSGTSGSSGSSSSGSSNDDGSDDGTPANTQALTSYTLTGDNTRILFSTMKGLIKGNQAQDVTVRSSNVEFTFAKGTMQLAAGTLWYDFGVTIDGGTQLKQEIEKLAGEHYVSLVHFNYEGNLPAKASIRIALGSAQAGKTLYYYKYLPASNSLNYMQSAVADATGWVTVEQSSCSDYVFLDADINAVNAQTPTPTETPAPAEATPSIPAAQVGSSKSSGFGGGWLIAVIVIVALLMIIAGICMYFKSRNAPDPFDDDGYDAAFGALGGPDDEQDEYEDPDGFDDDLFNDDATGYEDDPAPYRGPRRPR